jgi:hypothetical protein
MTEDKAGKKPAAPLLVPREVTSEPVETTPKAEADDVPRGTSRPSPARVRDDAAPLLIPRQQAPTAVDDDEPTSRPRAPRAFLSVRRAVAGALVLGLVSSGGLVVAGSHKEPAPRPLRSSGLSGVAGDALEAARARVVAIEAAAAKKRADERRAAAAKKRAAARRAAAKKRAAAKRRAAKRRTPSVSGSPAPASPRSQAPAQAPPPAPVQPQRPAPRKPSGSGGSGGGLHGAGPIL